MRKQGLPISATLLERWFAGRLNYSATDADEVAEIDQDRKPYAPDMYDMTTIKLDWVLRFPLAKEKFDYLTSKAVHSPAACEILIEKLIPYKGAVHQGHSNRGVGVSERQLHFY
jgi:Family of unknown function (DUF6402)